MSIQDLQKENEELKKKLLNQKCPTTDDTNPLDKVNKLDLNLPKNVKELEKPTTAEIKDCEVPSNYFGKTNSTNVKCKNALQEQIKHDRDVSKLIFILLTVICPIILVFFTLVNPSQLSFVHYLLLFIIISLSIITIASTQGKALDNNWIIWPTGVDCNSCQYNAKLPLISIFIGIGIAITAYIIDWVMRTIQ